MKKIVSFLLTVCMLTALCVPSVFATSSTEPQGELVYIGDGKATLSVEDIQDLENIEMYAVSTGRRIYSEGINVYVAVLENGERRYSPYAYHFAGSTSLSYTRGTLSKAKQNALFNYAINELQLEPIGWGILGSIFMDVARPQMFQYRRMTDAGTSDLLGQKAVNGSNDFLVETNFPANQNIDYTYGMKGTVSYQYKYGLEYLSGEMAVELSVCFSKS